MGIYRSSEANNFYKLITVCRPEHKVHIILCSEMHGYSHGYLKSAAISQLLHKQIDLSQTGNCTGQGRSQQLEISMHSSSCQPLPSLPKADLSLHTENNRVEVFKSTILVGY